MPDELRWFWQAFWELDTCRVFAETVPCKIPWTAVKEYAEYHDVDFDYLWRLIVCIDGAFIEYHTKKRQEEVDKLKNKSSDKKGGRRGRR